MMNHNSHYHQENELVRRKFNLEELLEFQLRHDVQIIRGEDYQYICYIDKKGYAPSITPLAALVSGVEGYKRQLTNVNSS